jgi:hypothetical protein
MSGHFEKGKWIEGNDLILVLPPDESDHFGIAISIPSCADELDHLVALLNLKPCHGDQWVAFLGNDGNWYSYIDIIREHLKRMK